MISSNRTSLYFYLLIALVTTAVYWQVAQHDFVSFDDYQYITNNPWVNRGLTAEGVNWAFTAFYEGNWHPLTWLSHMLDVEMYGMKATGHHLTNVFLHVTNALLLLFLLNRFTGAFWRSVFVAALFALHPLHVESVAWAAERKDVLSTLLCMLTLLAYGRYTAQPNLSRYLATFVLFILGLMAKPMLVTLPGILLLMDFWPLNRMDIGKNQLKAESSASGSACTTLLRIVLEKLPFLLISVVSCVVTYLAQQQSGSTAGSVPFDIRLGNALVSYVSYIGKIIWPHNLAAFYPFPDSIHFWQVSGAAVILMAISSTVFLLRRSSPYLTVGWLWYLGTLVPVIGFVKVGSQAMADRYSYIPSIGFFIMLVWGINALFATWRLQRRVVFIVALLVFSALSAQTWKQVGYWRNTVTLFEHSLIVTGTNFYANNILWTAKRDIQIEELFRSGVKLAREGNFVEAVDKLITYNIFRFLK